MNADDINIRVIAPGDAALVVLVGHDGVVEMSGNMPRHIVPGTLRQIADTFAAEEAAGSAGKPETEGATDDDGH
ncbi:hypothetical protein ACFY12_35085 [Streptomyces sp. NPDC001339]|uniref:hypothetical protein n=1 Tax=Streptomyces sp. NPDC001339 TaxID=3364563 RepID=UPI0036736C4B